LDLGLSTLQPKWHLLFDGHLLMQAVKFGGLSDKTDEYIEKGHQYLMMMMAAIVGFRKMNSL
jgi:hypothetical protein